VQKQLLDTDIIMDILTTTATINTVIITATINTVIITATINTVTITTVKIIKNQVCAKILQDTVEIGELAQIGKTEDGVQIAEMVLLGKAGGIQISNNGQKKGSVDYHVDVVVLLQLSCLFLNQYHNPYHNHKLDLDH